MYQVFVNKIPIILSTSPTKDKSYESYPIKSFQIMDVVQELLEGATRRVHLYHKTEKGLLNHLYKQMPVVLAAGGKVYNAENEILFIKRNGCWDLPKGKAEKHEGIEMTALREVEEETGVGGLEIVKFIHKTFHVFRHNGDIKLKVTYWFEMKTTHEGSLVPQHEEGIKKVKWKGYKKARKALRDTYPNIRLLFSKEYIGG